MADKSFKIEIDGREYLIPDDLDLNDGVLLEEKDKDEDWGYTARLRFIVWRLLRQENPDITEEEAGQRVKFAAAMREDEAQEEPPPIPLSEPDPLSGTPGEDSNGNGSTDTSVVEVTHVHSGLQR